MSGREQANLLLFNKWESRKIEIGDIGLQRVISLKPSVIPITFGRHEHQRLKKSEVNIVERLANKLMHTLGNGQESPRGICESCRERFSK